MKIADLYFEGRLDDGKLQIDAKKAGDKAGDTLGKSMAGKIKQSFSGAELGKGLVQGLGLAGALGGAALLTKGLGAVTDMIGSSIEAASDLNESLSKSSVVFGDAAKDVEDFAETADKALGLSKQAALEAAASFGNLFLGTGQTAEEAAKLSKSMVTLAGDLASFNNLDPGDALEKLRSGLTGEAEPLRAVGVFLTEAKVKAKAMELGLGNLHGELSEGDKVMARYKVILDETKTAQGDYARTADGVANSQRTLNAEIENAQAELGQKLLPLQAKWIALQRDSIPLLGGSIDAVGGLVTGFQTLGQQIELNLGGLNPYYHAQTSLNKKFDESVLHAKDFGTSLKDVADKGGRSATTLVKDIDRIRVATARLEIDMLAEAKAIVTDYFDVLIMKDDLAATNAEINALRKIQASRNLTAEEKANLHRLQQTQAQLLTDLAAAGAGSSKIVEDTLADLYKRLKTAHGAEKKMIEAEIRALILLAAKAAAAKGNIIALTLGKNGYVSAAGAAAASGGSAGRGDSHDFHGAAGGAMAAHEPGWVGERGPELFIPAVAGRVIPHGQSMAMAGSRSSGGDTYNVNLLDRMEVRSVRDIGAGLRMLEDTGHLGRRKR